jgi:DNA (cytosine-5)-methyltransferase 1
MRASWKAQGVNDGYVDCLTPMRALLAQQSTHYVIENVVGARKAMGTVILLHGAMFGLRVDRGRLFESSVLLMAPRMARTAQPVGVYDTHPRGKTHHRTRLNGNGKGRSEMRIARTLEEAQDAMGMDWADWHGTKEAIPPAYTEYLGRQLLQALGHEARATRHEITVTR